MSNKKYDEDTVVRQLSQKHDVRVNMVTGTIEILRDPYGKSDIGIKSKGKIDYLVNFRGFKVFFTSKFQ